MQIVNAGEIKTDDGAYLLYGAPGVGKTHTVHFLAGRTLYVSIDNSEKPLAGNENIDILRLDTHNAWQAWQDFVKWVASADLSEYTNIVIDNLSELTRSMLGHMGRVGKNNRVPTMMNYQQVDFMIIDSIRFLNSLKKRVVYFAWETHDQWTTQAGAVYNRAYPDLRDKILNNVMGLCNVVGRLMYNEKSGKRFYMLQPTDELYAKNQLDDRKFCLQQDVFAVGKESDESE